MEQRVWWSWKGSPGEDTTHLIPVDEDTQLLFVQEALGWGKVIVQGNFFQTHGLMYSQVGHCIQVAMGQGSLQNIRRCKIFQVDLLEPISKPVAAALAVYDNLTKLKLCELNMDLITVHAVFDALQSNRGLQTLVLDSVYMEDEAWTVVGRALARNKTLQHLRLRRTLSPTGLEAVCTIIINNKSLQSLDISDNKIGDEGMMHLLKALTVNYSIQRVVLSSNAFGDHGAHILSKVIQQSKTLTLLDVDSNNIGKMGARELGPALAANTSLQVFRLSRNFLDDASVTSIASAAGRHKKLELLDLSFNRMGPDGVLALAREIVRPSRAVESLLLHGNCMIGNDGALHLARVLPRARKLSRLDLSDCEIGDKGAVALAKGLARNKSLLDFRIAHNQITHEGAAAFASALRSNKTLKYFDFSFNWVGHRGIAPLKEVQTLVAERCHMVWELSLEYCQIEKFKYGDYTQQQDDTSTQQDQQETPMSHGGNPWSPRNGDDSDNDTHVTSTLTAISESRLEAESTRPPNSVRSLSITDGPSGPYHQSSHSSDGHTARAGVTSHAPAQPHTGNGLPPVSSVPPISPNSEMPHRQDSFESVSLGAVPPSPLGDESSTPGQSSTPGRDRGPFLQSAGSQKLSGRLEATLTRENIASEDARQSRHRLGQESGHGDRNVDDDEQVVAVSPSARPSQQSMEEISLHLLEAGDTNQYSEVAVDEENEPLEAAATGDSPPVGENEAFGVVKPESESAITNLADSSEAALQGMVDSAGAGHAVDVSVADSAVITSEPVAELVAALKVIADSATDIAADSAAVGPSANVAQPVITGVAGSVVTRPTASALQLEDLLASELAVSATPQASMDAPGSELVDIDIASSAMPMGESTEAGSTAVDESETLVRAAVEIIVPLEPSGNEVLNETGPSVDENDTSDRNSPMETGRHVEVSKADGENGGASDEPVVSGTSVAHVEAECEIRPEVDALGEISANSEPQGKVLSPGQGKVLSPVRGRLPSPGQGKALPPVKGKSSPSGQGKLSTPGGSAASSPARGNNLESHKGDGAGVKKPAGKSVAAVSPVRAQILKLEKAAGVLSKVSDFIAASSAGTFDLRKSQGGVQR